MYFKCLAKQNNISDCGVSEIMFVTFMVLGEQSEYCIFDKQKYQFFASDMVAFLVNIRIYTCQNFKK
jgi:Ulp1 family protease